MGKPQRNEPDRVRAQTADTVNERIDRSTRESIREYALRGRGAITRRIQELDREWDIERTLEMNAATVAFTGLVLGATVSRKFLMIPGIVLPFLFQHAVQGWCPPLPILRRSGFRSREEIDRERYALKALRGDFEEANNVESALDATRA